MPCKQIAGMKTNNNVTIIIAWLFICHLEWVDFREEVQCIQLAEKVLRLPRPADKHNFSLFGMTFFRSIAIICDAKMKRLSLGYFF